MILKTIIKAIVAVLILFNTAVSAATPKVKISKGVWNGCEMHTFSLEGREAKVIIPRQPLDGNPWIWRPAFFDAFPSIDKALLDAGFHVAYYDNTFEWARPEAMESGQKFYEYVTKKYNLMPRAVMNGISRGGYYSLRRSQLFPETTACLILDNPLVDIFELQRNPEWWADVQSKYALAQPPVRGHFKENALYSIDIPAKAKIPVILLSGGNDTIVPYENNGRILANVYERYNAPIKVIVRPEGGHHPHGLDNPETIVPYIKNAVYGNINKNAKIKVACIGNSITAGSGTSNPDTKSYPAILGKLLGDDYDVRNFGVPSCTALRHGTESGTPFCYLFTEGCRMAKEFLPDIVVLKLGGNDSKGYNWDKYGYEFPEDYQAIIDEFKYLPSLPRIYVCLPAKARVDNPDEIWGINESVIYNEITPIVKDIAHRNRLTVIDLHDAYEGEENSCYSDHIHPNDHGAELLARRIYNALRR